MNKSTSAGQDFASGLPPVVIFTHVPAYGSAEMLRGKVTGVDPPTVMGRYGIPPEVKDSAVADNEIARKLPKA